MPILKQRKFRSIVIQNSVYSALDNGVLAVFGLFYVLYLAQVLPKEMYGTVIIFDVIRNICMLFLMAVGQAVVKYTAEGDSLPEIVGSAFVLQFAYIFICSFLLIMFRVPLSQVLKSTQLADLILWLPALLVLNAIHILGSRVCWGLQEMKYVFVLDIFYVFIFILSTTVSSSLGLLTNAVTVIKLMVVARLASAVISVLFLSFKAGITPPRTTRVKQLWQFASPVYINSLGGLSASRLDRLMLGLFLSPIAVAIYNAGAVIFNAFMLIGETMNMLVLPRASKIHSKGIGLLDISLRHLYATASTSFLFISLPVVLVLFFFSEQMVSILYQNKYPEAADLFMIFACWGITIPMTRSAASILNGVGLPKVNVRVTWITVILNLALNLLLIPALGFVGAAYSALLTAITSLVCYLAIARKYFGLQLSDFYVWQYALAEFIDNMGNKDVEQQTR